MIKLHKKLLETINLWSYKKKKKKKKKKKNTTNET